jgi:hypothetical protein
MHLRGGETYPMVRYRNVPDHPTNPIPTRGIICLHVHESRFSYQIYVQTPESVAEGDILYDEGSPVTVRMQLHAEFTPNALVGPLVVMVPNFYQCQRLVYGLGIGPIPHPTRDGFAVSGLPRDAPSSLQCMVRHAQGRNGCTKPNGTCFFCVENPLYEFQREPEQPPTGISPWRSLDGMVKVGTTLLLSVACPDLLERFPAGLHGPTSRKRVRELGVDEAVDEAGDEAVDISHADSIVCWLQVPTNILNAPGKLYVAVQCRHGGGELRPYVLHVHPKSLRIPPSAEYTVWCRQYVAAPI